MMRFSIPVSVALTSEDSWKNMDTPTQFPNTNFGIARFHFEIEDVSASDAYRFGVAIGIYRRQQGVNATRTESEITSLESVMPLPTIEKYLRQRNDFQDMADDILTQMGLRGFHHSNDMVKKRVITHITASFAIRERIGTALKVTESVTEPIFNNIATDFEDTIVSALAYQKRDAHVFLTHVDYLKVQYQRTGFGLRKKAKSKPEFGGSGTPPNQVQVSSHFATVSYWKLMRGESRFLAQSAHTEPLDDPTEVTIAAPARIRSGTTDFPKVPTLYRIARAAFPRRWAFRKSPRQEWTEADLMAIELDEVRNKPGWWDIHGDD